MSNWTEADLVDHLKRRGVAHNAMASETDPPRIKALGKLSDPYEGMNKLERSYAAHLDRVKGGSIVWWAYEPVKLRIASSTFYKPDLTVKTVSTFYIPDFMVQTVSGQIEFHETKGGFWRDDARVKIKVAASLYPFRFLGIKAAKGGGWNVEEF